MTAPSAPAGAWARWAPAAAGGTFELLIARASGDPLAIVDLVAAVLLAALLGATGWPLLPLLVYGAGLLVPSLWGRGTGIAVWALCACAAAIATRRRPVGARGTVAGLAIAVVLVWLVVGAGEGHPPPLGTVGWVVAAGVGALVLGPRAVFLAPLALWPGASERWNSEGPVPVGPDVVIVSVDTLRLDAARGMASLKEGTLLEAQAPAPWTLPSLATLQTGLLPAHHGAVRVRAGFARTDSTTLAERFAAAGWDTAATVESPFAGARFGLQRGFARVRADGARPWVLPRAPFGDRSRPVAALVLSAVGLLPAEDGGAARRVRDVAEIVAERRDRPLYLWVHLLDAHLPYRHAVDLDLPASERIWLTTAHRLAIGPTPDAATLASLKRAYLHEVDVVDAAIARIRALLPDAVTVVTADHGEEFGEHGGFEHGHTLYQELLAVPLLVDNLAVAATGPVGLQDIVPTVLAAAGIPAAGLDGRDLAVPGDAPLPTVNLLYGPLESRAVRVGARKRVAELDGKDQPVRRNYDLAVDPGERAPFTDEVAPSRAFSELESLLPEPPAGTGAAVPLDPDATEALRALGYVE
ncbi:MAG: sulfatase-like hydrolase/transferase [Pseudomonadota bacterium]|nr:sulfatase-like hydrolase/transferase [Pseudomonadota bacterium]